MSARLLHAPLLLLLWQGQPTVYDTVTKDEFIEATFGATGWPRIGLEFGGHEVEKLRVFGGVSYAAAYRERRQAGFFFEAAVSLGGRFRHDGGILLQGFVPFKYDDGKLGTAGVGFWFLP